MIIYQKAFNIWSRHEIASETIKGETSQKVWKKELPLLYVTHCHGLFYTTVKCHDNIAKGIQVMERIQNCI